MKQKPPKYSFTKIESLEHLCQTFLEWMTVLKDDNFLLFGTY